MNRCVSIVALAALSAPVSALAAGDAAPAPVPPAIVSRVGQIMELGRDPVAVRRELVAEASRNIGRLHMNSALKRFYDDGIESLTPQGEMGAMLVDAIAALAVEERGLVALRTKIALESERLKMLSELAPGAANDPVPDLRASLQKTEASILRLKIRRLALETLLLEVGAAEIKDAKFALKLVRDMDYRGWRMAKPCPRLLC